MLRARIAGELTSLHPFARKSEELIHLHGFYFLTVMPCNNAEMGIIMKQVEGDIIYGGYY